MTDELDQDLVRAFEAEAVTLPSEDFIRQLRSLAIHRQRVRTVVWICLAALLCLIGSFAARPLLEISSVATEWLGEILISPVGWVLSVVLAVRVTKGQGLLRR
jgi:hypothetical protein